MLYARVVRVARQHAFFSKSLIELVKNRRKGPDACLHSGPSNPTASGTLRTPTESDLPDYQTYDKSAQDKPDGTGMKTGKDDRGGCQF